MNATGRAHDARGGAPGALIRLATRADLARVYEIERASFSDPWTRDSFASLLANPRVYFAVAERGGARAAGARAARDADVVGYVVAWLVVDEAEIANIAVSPDARGDGIGARLLDAALGVAVGRGAATAYLEVRESNAPARALYASRGFSPVGRRRNYYRRPVEDALVLRLDLDPSAFDDRG
ncbi:MAG: ribosomal protein S18-alanine N-acetyltransferase [Gemmatimonadaceae bacterium]